MGTRERKRKKVDFRNCREGSASALPRASRLQPRLNRGIDRESDLSGCRREGVRLEIYIFNSKGELPPEAWRSPPGVLIIYRIISIWYYIIYCIMLYCIILYYIILYCTILYHIILHHIILCYIVAYYIILIITYHGMLGAGMMPQVASRGI